MPVRRPLERARAADERPRDDAADAQPLADQLIRDLARAIQLRHRHDRPRARRSGTRCRPTCRRSSAPVRMCSAPSSSMIAVPDAAMLPSTAAAGAASELGDHVRRKAVAGTPGTARSSTMPIISQWPVTESLPADASAMRPTAPALASEPARRSRQIAARRGRRPERARSVGQLQRHAPARCCRACCCPGSP